MMSLDIRSASSNENLETLQQIYFFKESGFPLKKIKEIIMSPFWLEEAPQLHKKMLRKACQIR